MLREKLINVLEENNVKGAFAIRQLRPEGTDITYNSDLVVPSASLIKMFILIHAFDMIDRKKLKLSDMIPVRTEDIVDFSVLKFLSAREYSLEELLRLMIVYSDNTATNVLTDYFGMDAINETIQRVGCADSVMKRKMMDFRAAEEGRQNYTSAADMFSLLERMYRGGLLGKTLDDQMLEIMKGQADEEMMRRDIPDEITIARKSGELDALDHDIAIVYTDKCDYIYIFFTWDGRDCNQTRDILAVTSKMVFDEFMA